MNYVVTGASSGLGLCIARTLTYHGHDVEDWSLERGVDVTSLQQVRDLAANFTKLNGLINCAGAYHMACFEDLSPVDWDNVFNVNAKAIMLCTQALIGPLSHGGLVLNVLSNAAHVPMTYSMLYNASKAAAAMMTRQMGKELWKTRGITVIGVSPNKMHSTGMSNWTTKRYAQLADISEKDAIAYQATKLLTGVETHPIDVADFICWVATNYSEQMTGTILEYGA